MKRPRQLRMTRAAALLAAVAVTVALAGPVRADTQAQLDAAEKKLAKLVDQVSAEQKAVDSMRAKANDLARQLDQVASALARTQSRIVNLQQDIVETTREIGLTQGQLNQRAWVAYESGPGSSLEFLLGSTSLTDLTNRLEIVDSAAKSDESLIREIEDQRSTLQAKENSLQQLETQQLDQQNQLKDQNQQVQEQLAAEQDALDKLAKDRADADALVKKLKKQRAHEIALAKLAAQLAAGGGSGSGTKISGVLLVCPIPPNYALARYDDFGAPRYSGGYHLHAGNDLISNLGVPIEAPFPGTATQDPNGLGGLAVMVTGSLGYVYNAHLSRYAGNYPRHVNTGDVVGYVGNSGDAAGGPYHDHFEWHPNVIPAHPYVSSYGVSVIGSAIDPYPYLNAVCPLVS